MKIENVLLKGPVMFIRTLKIHSGNNGGGRQKIRIESDCADWGWCMIFIFLHSEGFRPNLYTAMDIRLHTIAIL